MRLLITGKGKGNMTSQTVEEQYLEQFRVMRTAWEEDRRTMSAPIGDLKAAVEFLNYCRRVHEEASQDTVGHMGYDPALKALFGDDYTMAAREVLVVERYTEAIELLNSLARDR